MIAIITLIAMEVRIIRTFGNITQILVITVSNKSIDDYNCSNINK